MVLFTQWLAQTNHHIAHHPLPILLAETLTNHALDAVALHCCGNNAFADGYAQPRPTHCVGLGMDRKPQICMSPLLQYPRKTFPARQSTTPGKY